MEKLKVRWKFEELDMVFTSDKQKIQLDIERWKRDQGLRYDAKVVFIDDEAESVVTSTPTEKKTKVLKNQEKQQENKTTNDEKNKID